MLLVSEADASYVARARELLASPDAEARLSARDWLVDGAIWGDALGRNGYRFRVMVVCADGTLRAHGEYDALEFARGGGRPVRLAPGLFYAMGWVGSVARQDAPRGEEFFRHVVLERSRWGVSWRRPARVVRHQIDVSGRVVELWVTWKLEWREGLRLARSMSGGRPPARMSS